MAGQNHRCNDRHILALNDAAEDALSKILRFGFDVARKAATADVDKVIKDQILTWGKHIANEIPGYANWQEIYEFTFDALTSPDAVPGEDTTPIGTEADLIAKLEDPDFVDRYSLQRTEIEKEYLDNPALSLLNAHYRQDILDRIPAPYSATNPMPNDLALLFRKVRYTYKLRECLLGHVGYYNGAFQFAADMDDDFEFHMYLIQMKLRRPDRLHLFKAPKMMTNYITDPGSVLPWNNQMTFAYSLDEFGPQQMPIFGVNYIERKLVEVLRLDVEGKKWAELCSLFNWNPRDPARVGELHRIKTQFSCMNSEQPKNADLTSESGNFLAGNLTLADCGFEILTLPLIISLMNCTEAKRKAFYTHFLGLTWSDTPLKKEGDILAQEYEKLARKAPRTGTTINSDLAHLLDFDIKHRTEINLALAQYYPRLRVVNYKANIIPTPKARWKLTRLSENELDQLFDNIPAYPRTESHSEKLDAVISQAIRATQNWQTRAIEHHRPIYSGISGQMLSYAQIFLRSSKDAESSCVKSDHPSLEQLRLTLLAGLIGFNRNHTYDECMTASHGLVHDGVTLEYKDPIGYRDIIDSEDPFIRDKVGKQLLHAMVAIGKEVIDSNSGETATGMVELPSPGWDSLVAKWFKDTTGHDFPVTDNLI